MGKTSIEGIIWQKLNWSWFKDNGRCIMEGAHLCNCFEEFNSEVKERNGVQTEGMGSSEGFVGLLTWEK